MKPKIQNFKDGSSLETLENGAYLLRENKLANTLPLAQETTRVNYNDPPPPPDTQAALEALDRN